MANEDQLPEALRLAAYLLIFAEPSSVDKEIAAELERQHAEIARLTAELAEARKLLECPRIELVTAIHTLASHFENALWAFRDDAEARRKAEGDIAHAMGVARKHNYNGTGCRRSLP